MKRINLLMLLLGLPISTTMAWSWQTAIFNITDKPIHYKFNSHNAGKAHADNGSGSQGTLEPNSSRTFQLTTGGTFNKTTDGVLEISNNADLTCKIRYYQESIYKAHNLSKWHLEAGSSEECKNIFFSDTAPSKDPWYNPIKILMNWVKFPRLTTGQMQCTGYDNCIVIQPQGHNHSEIQKTVGLQSHIADDYPLNVGQKLGTHNSFVSRGYSNNNLITNMSYADPNQYISVTDQLNQGMRQLEVDFLMTDGDFKLCHFRTDSQDIHNVADLLVCNGNHNLKSALVEINEWLKFNHDELLYIYLDNAQGWNNERVVRFNNIVNNVFANKVLTKDDIKSLGYSDPNNLPVSTITPNDIIKKLGKNLILYTYTEGGADLINSPYVFQHVVDNPNVRLHRDTSVNAYNEAYKQNAECQSITNAIYPDDLNHDSIWLIREDRTHLPVKKGNNYGPSYITNQDIATIKTCPVNVLSFDKLAFNDPRLYSSIWSWQDHYPIEGNASSNIASINPVSKRIHNDKFQGNLAVLCFSENNKWSVVNNAITSAQNLTTEELVSSAQAQCKAKDLGNFATPVTSSQMAEIVNAQSFESELLINYQRNDCKWQTNIPKAL